MSSGAPVEQGTPIRQPASALLCVDSADATSYVDKDGFPQKYITGGFRVDTNTPADIQINKQTPLLFGYMTRLALTEVAMEWSTPNVNVRNNTLTLVLTKRSTVGLPPVNVRYRVALEERFYLPDELATDLQVELNKLDADADWTVTYSRRANKFTIDLTTAGSVVNAFYMWSPLAPGLNWGVFDTDVGNVASPAGTTVPDGIVQDDLTYVMGLTVPYQYMTAMADIDIPEGLSNNIVSGYAPMCYTPYVDIISNRMTKNQNVQDNDTTIRNGTAKLARIYLRADDMKPCFDTNGDSSTGACNIVGVRPFSFRREFKTPKVIQWNTTENIDIIDLQVVDRLGFPIYIETLFQTDDVVTYDKFGNTANFQFTIQASET